MIAQIINGKVPVICLSHRLRQRTQTRGLIIHDIKQKPNSICVLLYILLNNLQKKTPLSEFAEKGFENTTQMRGSETRQTLNYHVNFTRYCI